MIIPMAVQPGICSNYDINNFELDNYCFMIISLPEFFLSKGIGITSSPSAS